MSFDWDNINVGNHQLNHSEGYFCPPGGEPENERNLPDLLDQVCSINNENDFNAENMERPTKSRAVLKTSFFKKDDKQMPTKANTFDKNYEFAKLIEVKRKKEIERKEQEMKKARQFIAKPAPKFKSPAKLKDNDQKFTVPSTPLQMKPDRLKKVAQLKEKIEKEVHPAVPLFKAHKPKVLEEEPFIPKKEKRMMVPEPFNLRSSTRLAERKAYDEQIDRKREEKRKMDEEARRKKEEEEIRIMRKQKEFKANPNPFK